MDEKRIIEALERILSSNRKELKNFNIGCPSDSCYCLVNEDGMWKTFSSEKRMRFKEQSFESAYYACLWFIGQVTKNDIEKVVLSRRFLEAITPEGSEQIAVI